MATYYTDIADLRLTAVLAAEIQLLLADRASLWRHPAITYLGDQAGSGSSTRKVPFAALGSTAMSAIAENASATDTAIVDASVSLSISRNVLQRSISDLANLTDSVGLNVTALATEAVEAASLRFMEMVCTAGASFTTVAGTTATAMSVNNWFDAQFGLTQASATGPAIACIYPKQWTDLQSSLRAESSNLIAFSPDDRSNLDLSGQGFVGRFNGVDIMVSTYVPTANAGADSAGFMAVQGAIGYAEGTVTSVRGGPEIIPVASTSVFTEISRDPSGALTKLVHNYYAAVAVLQDGMGVAIITDR